MRILLPRVAISYLLLLLMTSLAGCKKRVIEKLAVIETENVALPDGSTVSLLSFLNENTGYAVGSRLFKTTDGGKSWQDLSVAGITSMSFVDEDIGYCVVNGNLLKTVDGGQSFTTIAQAHKVTNTPEGHVITGTNEVFKTAIKMSINGGNSFFNLRTLSYSKVFSDLKVMDGFIVAIDQGDSNMEGIWLQDTSRKVGLTTNGAVDLCLSQGSGAAVGDRGNVAGRYAGTGFANGIFIDFSREYFGNAYEFKSVDAYNGIYVAVGRNTIVTTLDMNNEDKWNDVFDKDLNGFENTFHLVRFIGDRKFIVAGNDGLLWKAKL